MTLIVQAGGDNTLQVFGTHYANNPDYSGFSGVIVGLGLHDPGVHRVRAGGADRRGGARAAAHDPARDHLSPASASACFYLLNTYASAVSFGPANMTNFTADDSNPWQNVLARDAWGGLGFLLVFLALVNSIIANQNAANNSSTRTMFAMGRIRLLPDGARPADPFGSPLVRPARAARGVARRGAVPRVPLRPGTRASR